MCVLSVLWEKLGKWTIKQSVATEAVEVIALETEMLSIDRVRITWKKTLRVEWKAHKNWAGSPGFWSDFATIWLCDLGQIILISMSLSFMIQEMN